MAKTLVIGVDDWAFCSGNTAGIFTVIMEFVDKCGKEDGLADFVWTNNGSSFNKVMVHRSKTIDTIELGKADLDISVLDNYDYAIIFGEMDDNSEKLVDIAKACKEKDIYTIAFVQVKMGADYQGVVKPKLSEYTEVVLPREEKNYWKNEDHLTDEQNELLNKIKVPTIIRDRISADIEHVVGFIDVIDRREDDSKEARQKSIKARIAQYILTGN